MEWMEVVVHTTSEGAEIMAQALIDAGSSGANIVDKADIQPGAHPELHWEWVELDLQQQMPDDVLVKGYFPCDAAVQERLQTVRQTIARLQAMDLGLDLGTGDVTAATVNEEDWANNWKKYFKPFHAGKSIVVKPSWEPYTPEAGDIVLEMDPGMAFGTGTHETTALCVELLEDFVQPGDSVLDVGCGTGILAIASVLLGAEKALAVDIDALAVKVARENIARNGLQSRIQCRVGDLVKDVEENCDILVANIIADVICMLAEPAAARVRPGGTLITSGIIRDREADVREAMDAQGYVPLARKERGEWVALAFRRP